LERELAELEQQRKQRQRSADIKDEEKEQQRRIDQLKMFLHGGFHGF